MGRFSKLETGRQEAADQQDNVLPVPRAKKEAPDDGPDYSAEHYAAEADRNYFAGVYKHALKLYSRAIQADASRVDPWIGQVLCLLELRQYREAMVWVRRALELFPEDVRLVSLRGACYAHLGMVQQGIGCSDYAMNLSGTDPLVWIMRGEILALADNRNASICFDKAMEVRPHGDWRTPMHIGLLCIRQKRWSQAADYLRKATEHASSNDFLWERLGYALERLASMPAALEAYRAALHLNPQNTAADNGIQRLTRTPFFVRFMRRIFG